MASTETFDCPRCEGTGTERYYARRDGSWACRVCDGTKIVAINVDAIQATLWTSHGGTRRFRASKTSTMKATFGAEYVWRNARFHGGKDMSLPIMSYDTVGVYGIVTHQARVMLRRLDEIANAVAVEAFGSNMRAARRWGQALGMI